MPKLTVLILLSVAAIAVFAIVVGRFNSGAQLQQADPLLEDLCKINPDHEDCS